MAFHILGAATQMFKKFGGCKWRNRGLLRYNSSECLLYALKTSRVLLWTTKQDGISIIKSRRDQSRSNRDGHSVIHG